VLLKNPHVSVNLQDLESGYTALHRALFAGNIRAARDLLVRNDVDITIKDAEGYTAFDLYNGTVDGVSWISDSKSLKLTRNRLIRRAMSTGPTYMFGE
jgi:hypothetical protein